MFDWILDEDLAHFRNVKLLPKERGYWASYEIQVLPRFLAWILRKPQWEKRRAFSNSGGIIWFDYETDRTVPFRVRQELELQVIRREALLDLAFQTRQDTQAKSSGSPPT